MNLAVEDKPKEEVELPQVIKKVGVIGAGQMGTGISHVIALGGYDVALNDLKKATVDAFARVRLAIEAAEEERSRLARTLDERDDLLRSIHGRIGGSGRARAAELTSMKAFVHAVERDVAELRRMFPDVDPDAVLAVYTGFAGNFETTYEMLTLALAENRARVHHGRDEHDDD